MKLYSFAARSVLLCCFLFSSPTLAASPRQHYASIRDFLAGQSTIRILVDDATGYGLQVASQNLLVKLREKGFKGKFEVIYSTRVTDKITTLFDLPARLPAVYDDIKDGILFITLKEFILRHQNKTLEPVALGMSGGLNIDPGGIALKNGIDVFNAMSQIDLLNHANFMNVAVFAQLVTFYKYPNFIYVANDADPSHFPQKNSMNKFVTTPFPGLSQVKSYLLQDERGILLARQRPALMTFINGMEKQFYNVLPVYGITLKADCRNDAGTTGCFPGNMLQIIAAARYAQLHGSVQFHKPLVIAVFYDFTSEANLLSSLLQSRNWGRFELPGAREARAAVRELQLPDNFQTADIKNPQSISILKNLRNNQILLLSLGSMPKNVFDGLYNHTGENIWPAIREGNNSFATLITTGRPHLRCGNHWELGSLEMSDTGLEKQFASLYKEQGFCRGMNTWQGNAGLYKVVGGIFISASNPQSPISRYFLKIRDYVSKPENDRLDFALQEVLRIINQS